MMLIVAHHYVVNIGLMYIITEEPATSKSLYLWLLGMWGKTGINCFVLITGTFYVPLEFHSAKVSETFLRGDFL